MNVLNVQSSVFSVPSYTAKRNEKAMANTESIAKDEQNNGVTENTFCKSLSLAEAKSKGPLGITYNRYQWLANELSGFRNELLSGKHTSQKEFLINSMTSLKNSMMNLEKHDVKIEFSANKVTLDTSPIKESTASAQNIIDCITQFGASDSSLWINDVKRSKPDLLLNVQKEVTKTMGQKYNWTDITSKGLGLNQVGTDTNDIAEKISHAVSVINGYSSGILSVLKDVPNIPIDYSCPYSCVMDLPTMSFIV